MMQTQCVVAPSSVFLVSAMQTPTTCARACEFVKLVGGDRKQELASTLAAERISPGGGGVLSDC